MNTEAMKKIEQGIRLRIQEAILVELNDEQLNELVADEVRRFLAPREVPRYGETRREPSHLEELVREELGKRVNKAVNSAVEEYAQTEWGGGNEMIHAKIAEVIQAKASEVLGQALANLVTVNGLRS